MINRAIGKRSTAKDAKDAKETTTGELRAFVQNSVSGSVVFRIRKQVFYFASFASLAVNVFLPLNK